MGKIKRNESEAMTEDFQTDNAPRPVGFYPHAKRVGKLLFLSGVGPRKPNSDVIPGVKSDESGNIIFSVRLSHVNQSVIELDDGDLVIGGFGFREGNSGGPISLLRLDPSNLNPAAN